MKKFLKWLDNYWYHYKWPTIIGVFTAVFVVIMAVQFFTREEFDVTVVYAGPVQPTANQIRDVESEFAKIMPGDRNGDNKKNCQLTDFYLLTEEQIEEKNAEAASDTDAYYVNRNAVQSAKEQFVNQVSAGESSICLLDPAWYDLLQKQGIIVPLGEVLGAVPDYALDDYGVRLADTPFGKFYGALQIFPEDTVLCLLRLSEASAFGNKSAAEERFEFDKSVFRAMIEFE